MAATTSLTRIKYSWAFNNLSDNSFEESPNFGAIGSLTKFYLRLTDRGDLTLHLATCPQAKLYITKFKVEGFIDDDIRFTDTHSGEISLNRGTLSCSIFDNDNGDDVNKAWYIYCTVTYREPLIKTDQNQKLSEHLAAFRLDTDHCDFTLVTLPDGREHQVHKAILSMRSPVFAKMFKHEGLVENVLNRVEIEGVAGEVMEAFFDFIYSGDTNKVEQFAGELFGLADKYDIPVLAGACIEAITLDNAAELYYLADLHQKDDLKQKTMLFIRENKDAIKGSNGWNEIIKSNASLLYQLIDRFWFA